MNHFLFLIFFWFCTARSVDKESQIFFLEIYKFCLDFIMRLASFLNCSRVRFCTGLNFVLQLALFCNFSVTFIFVPRAARAHSGTRKFCAQSHCNRLFLYLSHVFCFEFCIYLIFLIFSNREQHIDRHRQEIPFKVSL